jgi:hypothetical protein
VFVAIIRRKFCLLALLLSMGFGLLGCGGAEQSMGAVRVLHLIPDAPALWIQHPDSGARATQPLDFAQASLRLLLPAGQQRLAFVHHWPNQQEALALQETTLKLRAGQQHWLVLYGTASDLQTLQLEQPPLPPQGPARLRLLGLADTALDVYLSPPEAPVAPEYLVGRLDYQQSLPALALEPGPYRVRLTAPGSGEVVFDSGELLVLAGQDWLMASLWAPPRMPGDGEKRLRLMTVTDKAQALLPSQDEGARLRLVNGLGSDLGSSLSALLSTTFSPSLEAGSTPAENSAAPASGLRVEQQAPGITATGDIASGSAPTPSNTLPERGPLLYTGFASQSPYKPYPSGDYRFTWLNQQAAAPSAELAKRLQNGISYSVYALDGATGPSLAIQRDLARPLQGEAQLRWLHSAPMAPTVDLYLQSAQLPQQITPLRLGQISAYQRLPPGDYWLQVLRAGSQEPLAPAQQLRLEAGQLYSWILRSEGNGVMGEWLTTY